MANPTLPGRAVVTGASLGIGATFARRLAKDGHALTLVARGADKLDELAGELRKSGADVDTIPADLTTPAGVDAVAQRLASDDSVTMLINNAGMAVYKPLAETDEADLDAMVLLNVWQLVRLTRAVLPGMLNRNRGTIINLSSGLAFSSMATRATYSGAKSFVNVFTQSLAEEVKGTGVRVQALCPTITRTPFHDRSGTDLSKVPQHLIMEPEPLVEACLRGLEMGELICVPALQDASLLTKLDAARAAANENMRQTNVPAARYGLDG